MQIARTLSSKPRHLSVVRHGAPPRKPPSKSVRPRKFLNQQEIKALLFSALMTGRHCTRDYAMVLVGYRHALRVSELVSLEWGHLNLDAGTIVVNRAKGGQDGMHYLEPDEIKALRALPVRGRWVFKSERGHGHLTENGAFKIIQRLGEVAGIQFPIHTHMLRHSKLTSLANRGVNAFRIQGFAGHKSIASTLEYIHMAAETNRGLAGD